jgi:hypothetical protein
MNQIHLPLNCYEKFWETVCLRVFSESPVASVSLLPMLGVVVGNISYTY